MIHLLTVRYAEQGYKMFFTIGNHPGLKFKAKKERKEFLKNNFNNLGYGYFFWVILGAIFFGVWVAGACVDNDMSGNAVAFFSYSSMFFFWFLGYFIVLNTIVKSRVDKLLN